jgi:hypothetical protein
VDTTPPEAPTLRNQLKPALPSISRERTDSGFSPLEPREGDYPIWLRLIGYPGSYPRANFPFPGTWFADAIRRGSPCVPSHCLAMSQPEELLPGMINPAPELFRPYFRHLLPMTNVPPHVCHARGSRVSCHPDLAEHGIFQPALSTVTSDCSSARPGLIVPYPFGPMITQTLRKHEVQVGITAHSYLGLRISKDLRRLFIVDLTH